MAMLIFHSRNCGAPTSQAEREGFEPPLVLPKAVFKTAAINHSAISPGAKIKQFLIPQSNLNYPNADLFVYLYIVKIN